MLLSVLVSLLVFAGEGEPSAPTESAPPEVTITPQATAVEDKDRMVCRRESIPNSRFKIKTCRTVSEWEQRAEAARKAFDEVQNRPVISLERGN